MPLQWLAWEIIQQMVEGLHFIADSIAALQEAVEAYKLGCLQTTIYVQFL